MTIVHHILTRAGAVRKPPKSSGVSPARVFEEAITRLLLRPWVSHEGEERSPHEVIPSGVVVQPAKDFSHAAGGNPDVATPWVPVPESRT